jgi:hypothetical protein
MIEEEKLKLMDSLCRFGIGQTLYTKVSVEIIERAIAGKKKRRLAEPQPLQVIERWVSQCYGGVQVNYVVRPHIVDRWNDAVGFGTELQKMVEIELTDVLPVWPEPAPESPAEE